MINYLIYYLEPNAELRGWATITEKLC
jgi:hypothetical protein